MEKPNKRRRAVWIVLVIVLVLVVGIGALAMWQKNNIEAVVQYTQYSKEELETKLEENDKEVEQVLEEAISNAQKVDAEAKPMEPPKPVEPEPAEPAVPEAPQPAEPVPEAPREPTYEEQLKALVDRVYALRDEYVQALENMEQEAVETYRALPPEKRTKKGKIEFASGYITKATELERECDGKMDELVKELDALQKKYNQSAELVNTVKYTYAKEKSLKKAWYMSRLEEKGMI